MPNLARPGESCFCKVPKEPAAAECSVTLPEPPVAAYIAPFGWIDTDQAFRRRKHGAADRE